MDKNFIFFPFFNHGVYFALKLIEILNHSIPNFGLFQNKMISPNKDIELFKKQQNEIFNIMNKCGICDLFIDLSKSGEDKSATNNDIHIDHFIICRPSFINIPFVKFHKWKNIDMKTNNPFSQKDHTRS